MNIWQKGEYTGRIDAIDKNIKKLKQELNDKEYENIETKYLSTYREVEVGILIMFDLLIII